MMLDLARVLMIKLKQQHSVVLVVVLMFAAAVFQSAGRAETPSRASPEQRIAEREAKIEQLDAKRNDYLEMERSKTLLKNQRRLAALNAQVLQAHILKKKAEIEALEQIRDGKPKEQVLLGEQVGIDKWKEAIQLLRVAELRASRWRIQELKFPRDQQGRPGKSAQTLSEWVAYMRDAAQKIYNPEKHLHSLAEQRRAAARNLTGREQELENFRADVLDAVALVKLGERKRLRAIAGGADATEVRLATKIGAAEYDRAIKALDQARYRATLNDMERIKIGSHTLQGWHDRIKEKRTNIYDVAGDAPPIRGAVTCELGREPKQLGVRSEGRWKYQLIELLFFIRNTTDFALTCPSVKGKDDFTYGYIEFYTANEKKKHGQENFLSIPDAGQIHAASQAKYKDLAVSGGTVVHEIRIKAPPKFDMKEPQKFDMKEPQKFDIKAPQKFEWKGEYKYHRKCHVYQDRETWFEFTCKWQSP